MLTGDATFDTEEQIVLGYDSEFLDVELLKIGHHGSSATSTSQGFVDLLRPKVAVVSAGFNSPFEHPRKSVIDRVADSTPESAPPHFMRWGVRQGRDTVLRTISDYREAIFSTSSNGHVVVQTDGTTCNLKYGRRGRRYGEMAFLAESPDGVDDETLNRSLTSISDARVAMSLVEPNLSPAARRIRSLELETDQADISHFDASPRSSSFSKPRSDARGNGSLMLGTEVAVITPAGTVIGTLQSVDGDSVTVQEAGKGSPTLISSSSMIIRSNN